LNINGYNESGIPDYEEPHPAGRKGISIAYPATVFSVNEHGSGRDVYVTGSGKQ